MVTQDRLEEVLQYDPNTGLFRWRVDTGRARAGDVAGCIGNDGYEQIHLDNKIYPAHRLAWVIMTGDQPEGQIDHINRDKLDNRLDNLRDVSHSVNQRNRLKSGVISGVNWHKGTRKWQVRIGTGKRSEHLGVFKDYFEACCCRKSAEHRLDYR